MGPISPAKGPAPITLPMLQNLMKRDPLGYTDEFRRRYRHFQSVLALHREQPSADSKDMVASVSFISHVSPCYPEVARELPAQLASLLEEQHDTLDSNLRAALFQALVLLRNRGMLKALDLLQLCFRLFRCRSKVLRAKVIAHVLADLKLVNLKHKDVTLNRALQNYVITMLTDVSSSAAKYSLNVMIQMYRRGIWRDAKTVNVVAGALFCPHPKLRVAAIHFLLGAHDLAAGAADSDDEEAEQNKKARVDDLRGSLGRNGALVKTAVKKRKRALKRATRSAKSLEKDKEGDSGGNGNFAAIHLLHDPHTLAERLLSDVRKSNERFEVTGILAACVQASHELVPPDMLEPVVKTLVNHFVSDKSRPEVITLGLNTVRELCVRVPLCMDAALLADLIEYRKEKDRGVVSAARGLLQHYRDVMPELLPKKLRGRGTDVTMRPAAFGALAVAEGVDGAELLAAREARLAAKGVDVDHEAEQEWQSLASSASARPDISRLLTPKDFDRIRRLKHRQKEIASLRGAKRKRAESEMLDSDEEEEAEARRRGGAGIEGEAVDEKDIIGYQAKRAATREEKIANTLAGREGRAQFGRRQKKKTGGKSNEEKKKSKPFMMARNASKLKGKAMNKEANRIKAARRAKKMFRGALRKGDNRR
ncbi:protein sda1-like protein [Chrysochromulina tobinii]|uniref:Protein SDA1 n=1 Tax=Chrysochromulina tobinii TaxID=1460289 RepID=A0A0M0LQT7_9EUKA|nr:protein sda1-like protein [Chrysochromulina tobinii]|eukprot:KOO53420.1 protein sda1-like protein [Chrysochromulina sp. CCMP291]